LFSPANTKTPGKPLIDEQLPDSGNPSETMAMAQFEIGYAAKCQKNHKMLKSPQAERTSHHLLE
jgi:hypothetical protein